MTACSFNCSESTLSSFSCFFYLFLSFTFLLTVSFILALTSTDIITSAPTQIRFLPGLRGVFVLLGQMRSLA